ncbi:MAG: hypothetical protein N3D16_09745, partial [Anaerolineales bacterium]|nr:hypothetical protein [Anaerolineales bacterium]
RTQCALFNRRFTCSTLYGLVRTTQDVDIVTAMQLEHVEPFVSALQDEFYVYEDSIRDAICHKTGLDILHREALLMDVFILPYRPYLRSQFERARWQTIDLETSLGSWFASPEDTILAALGRYPVSGEVSEPQWRDILGVMKVSADILDWDYLHNLADALDLREVFERALRGAKL